MLNVILVSKSPRRRALLSQIVPVFDVIPPYCDEKIEDFKSHEEYVVSLALKKLKSIPERYRSSDNMLIAADTVVVLDDIILGKPSSLEEAKAMLRMLSGKTHRVYTGVAVFRGGVIKSGCDVTFVSFKDLSSAEIEYYIDLVNPLDKAGAYAIQEHGELFINKIEGSYSNVVGLPLSLTYSLMKELGFKLFKWVKLLDIAKVIRSKNAGPFELTFDVMFDDEKVYEKFKGMNFLTKERFAKLYNIKLEDILVFEYFDQALALKITVKRDPPSGHFNDEDIYGAQKHVPLMSYMIPWENYE